MKLSKATIIKFFIIHLVTLTKAHESKCNNMTEKPNVSPTKEATSRPDSSTPDDSSTTTHTTTGTDCTVPGVHVIVNGSFYVNDKCTRMYNCTDGHMSVNEEYKCSSNAVCEVRDGRNRCYCSNGYQGNGETCEQMTNCLDLYNAGNTANGIYTIKLSMRSEPPFNVYCNMTDGGGWTVFQRRVDGYVDFNRTWNSYKQGFGELDREFWLGTDKLHYLTNNGNFSLRVDMVNKNGNPYYAKFDMFRINDERDNYRLSELGNFSGTADEAGGPPGGYALSLHLDHPFSTFDRDNDADTINNCAADRKGAWWYTSGCGTSNLNGDYNATDDSSSIFWSLLPGSWYYIKYTEMKIRPI